MYKWRHLVENFFCKLKGFKKVAMRAEKTGSSFSANIYLAVTYRLAVMSTDPSNLTIADTQPYAYANFPLRISRHNAWRRHRRRLFQDFKEPLMNPLLFAGSIIAATFAFASAPALADDDDAYYARHRKQFITHERAAQIARQAVKGGRVTSVEFDHEARDDHFDVDVRTADGREYDVKIDARSGKVRYVKRDD